MLFSAMTLPIASYVKAGKAKFTIVSTATKTRFTFEVEKLKGTELFFVKVLSGPDNITDYQFIGTIFRDNCFRYSRKSRVGSEAKSVKAFEWFWRNASGLPTACEFLKSRACCRCGRPLTTPESLSLGYGPECAKSLF